MGASKKKKGLGQFILVVLLTIEDLIKAVWETAQKSELTMDGRMKMPLTYPASIVLDGVY